jgi:hypothetical protein
MKHPNWRVVLGMALLVPAVGMAQNRSGLLLPLPTSAATGAATGRAQPGVSTSSPLGFGPNFGDVFVGAGYQARARNTENDDGSASFGFGLGDSRRYVGLEVVVTSLSTVNEGFFKRTAAGFKVHHNLTSSSAIGAGVEGVMLNGSTDSKETYYVALSKYAQLGSGQMLNGVMLNVGAGNGRFQSEDDFLAGKNDWNVFASAGLRVTSWLGAIADWTGQDLNLGASLVPVKQWPIVITPAVADVTQRAGDGARFTVGFGASWHFQ